MLAHAQPGWAIIYRIARDPELALEERAQVIQSGLQRAHLFTKILHIIPCPTTCTPEFTALFPSKDKAECDSWSFCSFQRPLSAGLLLAFPRKRPLCHSTPDHVLTADPCIRLFPIIASQRTLVSVYSLSCPLKGPLCQFTPYHFQTKNPCASLLPIISSQRTLVSGYSLSCPHKGPLCQVIPYHFRTKNPCAS